MSLATCLNKLGTAVSPADRQRLAELTDSGVDEIALTLRGYIADNKPAKVVIDFDGVKFFSSNMLGLLVDIWKRMKEYEGRMIISGIDPELNRVFKITNLNRVFEFNSDRDGAIKQFKAN